MERKRAVLLLISSAMISPPADGHGVATSLAPFFIDISSVDSYAWGAALLSELYEELRKAKQTDVKTLGGNLWVVIAFFLIRIPKLQALFDMSDISNEKGRPLLHRILESIQKASFNHNRNSNSSVAAVLIELAHKDSDLVDELTDIVWKPYNSEMLPPRVRCQERVVTRLSPLFFNGIVVNHTPYTSPKQFVLHADLDISSSKKPKRIKTTQLRGHHERNLFEKYKDELLEWNKCKLLVGRACPIVAVFSRRNKTNPEAHDNIGRHDSYEEEAHDNIGRHDSYEEEIAESDRGSKITKATDLRKSRTHRKIRRLYLSTYEKGHNVGYWRSGLSSIKLKKLFRFLDSHTSQDTCLLRKFNNYTTMKDCAFYKNDVCVSDNYVRVAAYMYTFAWKKFIIDRSYRVMLVLYY